MNQAPVGPQVRLRDYRRLVGLSAEGLAERIHEQGVRVHPDHLRNVELGHQRASGKLLRAWASALGLEPLDVWQPPAIAVEDDTSLVDAA